MTDRYSKLAEDVQYRQDSRVDRNRVFGSDHNETYET
jgi:hypothetical protein